MTRQSLVLRDAGPDDAAQLIDLWVEVGRVVDPSYPHSLADATSALAHLAAAPDERLVVGDRDGRIVAALHMQRGPITPIHTEQVVHTSYLLVHPDFRRHGYGRALLEAAVHWAEEKDIRHLTSLTASNSRDTNRFLARLGLATVATARFCSTSSLRKRLAAERGARGPRSDHAGNRHLGEVLAARRSMRRRVSEE